MNNQKNFLKLIEERTLVCDGAMGTMLQEKGLPAGHCPEEWNLSHPDDVASIHKAYYDAGADLVETNTFGGNRFRLKSHGFEDKVAELNRKGAELVRSVCPQGKFVAGSVGPTGEFLEPVGTVSFDQMVDVFCEQIEALLNGGVDLIIIETMMDIEEARAGVTAAKKVNPGVPVIAAMTFELGKAGFRTMMGVEPRNMIEKLPAAGADVIGSNCGKGMDEMIGIIKELRQHTNYPLLAQSNAGIPVWKNDRSVYTETPEQRASAVEKLLEFEVNIVGGCCGTTPQHIAAIRKVVDEFNEKK